MAQIYTDCPVCGRQIEEPRKIPSHESYDLTFSHYRSHAPNCRVFLTVHPDGTYESRPIPTEMSFEQVLCEWAA